jgi:hypothetical protein
MPHIRSQTQIGIAQDDAGICIDDGKILKKILGRLVEIIGEHNYALLVPRQDMPQKMRGVVIGTHGSGVRPLLMRIIGTDCIQIDAGIRAVRTHVEASCLDITGTAIIQSLVDLIIDADTAYVGIEIRIVRKNLIGRYAF